MFAIPIYKKSVADKTADAFDGNGDFVVITFVDVTENVCKVDSKTA